MKINGPGESPLLLLKVIRLLEARDIPYAIVGAFAASFHGSVRASLDADAVISLKGHKEKLDELEVSLIKDGLKVKLRRGDAHDPIRSVLNIEDKFQNRVDLLAGIKGMEDQVFDRVVTATFMGASIQFVSAEDFVAMKIFAGSPKNIQDALSVLKISKAKIKLSLIKKLTLHYGKKELARLEKLLDSTG